MVAPKKQMGGLRYESVGGRSSGVSGGPRGGAAPKAAPKTSSNWEKEIAREAAKIAKMRKRDTTQSQMIKYK